MIKKKIVWALFDDGERSYYNALKDDDRYMVISIGINKKHPENDNYKIIDLSITNLDLFKELNKLPAPDVIIASPPCESWSMADNPCFAWTSISDLGDKGVEVLLKNERFYTMWNEKGIKNRFRYFRNKEIKRIIGENTVAALCEIIKEYKPETWIIENPATSKIFDWIKYFHCLFGFPKKTYYSAYNKEFSLKPTIFYSNTFLDLKDKRTEGKKWGMFGSRLADNCNYDIRSKIPAELIQDIFKNLG
ncbi:hypothetical protein [Mycoplasmopsis primatum]|uniref:hypothetical protein n=1 Tax=Mycoplasmopsis primatum TaxID=55604 RepID=UPI000690DFAC|nr:hypothetical protein [Mycoplasmopsis primatum]